MTNEQAERRGRRPRRATAYFIIIAASAIIALGAAWTAAHPNGRAATYQRP